LYFGVGGTMRQFEQLVLEDNVFDVTTVWKSETGNINVVITQIYIKQLNNQINLISGVQREIIKLQRKNTI